MLGAGPAGSVLAALLVERGHEVVVFDDGRQPDLIVGESLVPALVPILRRLGIESGWLKSGCINPGSILFSAPTTTLLSIFAPRPTVVFPPYPITCLVRLLINFWRTVPAKREQSWSLTRAAVLKRGADAVELATESLAAAPTLQGRQPDLIVDATGRRRLIARTLNIPARVGGRKDVAYFAHFEGIAAAKLRGQVSIARMAEGWSWRIPLRDRVSVGIVLNKEAAARLGSNPEERLEAALRKRSLLGGGWATGPPD